MSDWVNRAAQRVELASRALEHASGDLYIARHEGLPVADSGEREEAEAHRIELLAEEIAKLAVG
jgi:hypothetical protein